MKTVTDNQTLYHLIRDYMQAMGTSRTTIVALQSYIDAVRRLDCNESDFKPLMLELNQVIKSAEPKIVSLTHLIEEFEAEMETHSMGSLDQIKERTAELLTQKLKRFETDTLKLTRHCADRIETGDFIIASSPTAYICDAFAVAHKELSRSFRVLALKQDFLRTRELVKTLEHHQIPYELIPQYNLSHYLGQTTKLFISAVSVTTDQKAVTGLGTANVVSICHAHNVPVYLFVESLKFSHTPLSDQHIYREETETKESNITFHMTTYSNDFVGMHRVDHLITENGEKPQQ
ncbi:MAG: translation initiation factor eIF-2B [Proteobacteria bacterium]|nr:translation initiation factor eIF-2B [Pseudomonadota bacterium]